MSHLLERRVLGEFFNGITAVQQDALVDACDLGLAGNNPGEARTVARILIGHGALSFLLLRRRVDPASILEEVVQLLAGLHPIEHRLLGT